jgi:hypothetical protein
VLKISALPSGPDGGRTEEFIRTGIVQQVNLERLSQIKAVFRAMMTKYGGKWIVYHYHLSWIVIEQWFSQCTSILLQGNSRGFLLPNPMSSKWGPQLCQSRMVTLVHSTELQQLPTYRWR